MKIRKKLWVLGGALILFLWLSGCSQIGEGVPIWDALVGLLPGGCASSNNRAATPGQPSPSQQQHESRIGRTFTDSTGTIWRVLNEDDNRNLLIMTEYVHMVGVRHNPNFYWVPYYDTEIRERLADWFYDELAPALRFLALPAGNLWNDVRTEAVEGLAHSDWSRENSSEGWTYAGEGIATGNNAPFILSVSEFNRYLTLGPAWDWRNSARIAFDVRAMDWSSVDRLNAMPAWFLRSPGSFFPSSDPDGRAHMAVVDREGSIRNGDTVGDIVGAPGAWAIRGGIRPALWISSPD